MMRPMNQAQTNRFRHRGWMLLVCILLALPFASTANAQGREKNVTLKCVNEKLTDALKKVERQSDYKIVFSYEVLNPIRVTVNISNMPAPAAVKKLIAGHPLTSVVNGKFIHVVRKKGVAGTASILTGNVHDELGEPLSGVTVRIAGTHAATITDAEGGFSIPDVEKGASVLFSYVGYEPKEVAWNGRNLEVAMEPTYNVLNETVVVGFGTQKKGNLTGAVSSVSGKELAARPINSVVEALQGMVPGLEVSGADNGGQLNSTRSMNIRGVGTIGTGSSVDPLVLIDGMEGDLSALNPADVENISVLKDASASSIYGSRAAGGVILVTTKSGRQQRAKVNYSDSFRWSKAVNMPKMVDSYTWANYMNQCSINAGSGVWFSDEKLAQIKKAQTDPSMVTMFRNPASNQWELQYNTPLLPIGNTNWLNEHFGKTAFSQEHNLSITGGSEAYDYYLSGNLLDRAGNLRYGNDNAQRYSFNAKVNVKLNKYLRFIYNNRWTRQQYDSPSMLTTGFNMFYYNLIQYWPIIPAYDPNGHPLVYSYIDVLENGGRYKTQNDQTDQQFTFVCTPMQGMNIRAEFNYRNSHDNTHQYQLQGYGWDCDGNPYEENPLGMNPGTYVADYNRRSNYFNPNIFGDYTFSLDENNNFKVMAGFQSERYRYEAINASNTGIVNNLPFLSKTDGNDKNVGGGTQSWATAGWFGRVNYDYKGRYLAEVNLRYDGSSRFRADTRWNWSPSFSLGWNIAKESFWEPMTGVCNLLKLRASWGKLGNQNTMSWYPTYANMGYNPASSSWIWNDRKWTTSTMPALVSSTLTWEKNETYNVGFDWGLFNNRLTGSADYYIRKTIDMVGPGETLPDVLGAQVPDVNNLSMTSKGWELQISWRDLIGDFAYGIGFNLYDHVETVDFYPNPANNIFQYYKGAQPNNIWGYTTIGIAKTDEEMNAHLDQLDRNYELKYGHAPATPRTGQNRLGTGWKAGDIMYADINGDGVISTGKYTLEDPGDFSIIGNTTPRYCFGLNLDASWRGFDLRAFFQGVMKRDYLAYGAPFWGGVGQYKYQATCLEEHLDYFRPADTKDPLGPNLDAYYPAANWGGSRNTRNQTRYIQDASYCRLKNLTIGYTIPQRLTRKVAMDKVRVFVSGENLFTITKFTKTGDPELIDAYGSNGFGKTYPLSRVMSFGLNVTF